MEVTYQMASESSLEAPAISLLESILLSHLTHCHISGPLQTKFIPSRIGETKATSDIRKKQTRQVMENFCINNG